MSLKKGMIGIENDAFERIYAIRIRLGYVKA